MSDRLSEIDRAFGPLPTLPAYVPPARTGLFGPALSAGWNELQGTLGAGAQAFGTAIGSPTIAGWGRGVAERNMAEAQAAGRPDLETAPWQEGGGGLLGTPAWLAYQATKQLPQIGVTLAGALLAQRMGVPVPGALQRGAAATPAWLGGGGLRAGMSAAEQAAAEATGASVARGVVGGAVAGYPISVGSIMQEANERAAAGGAQPGRGDAAYALGMGVPYSLLESFQPAQIESFVRRGAAGSIGQRVARGAAAGVATEAPVEAVQTAMELGLRPDMTAAQKANQIVDAALTGGAVGSVFGGAASMRAARRLPPAAVTEDVQKEVIDAALSPEAATGAVPAATQQPTVETPPPPAALKVPTGPLAQVEDGELRQAFQALGAGQVADGMDEMDRVSLWGAIREELTRRRNPGEMPDGQLQGLISAADVAAQNNVRLSAEEQARAQAGQMEALYREFPDKPLLGNLVQGVRNADTAPAKKKAPATPVEEAADVLRLLDKGSASDAVFKRAAALGLVDEKGNRRDLDAEIEAAHEARRAAMAMVPLRGDEPVRQAEAQIAQLEGVAAQVGEAKVLLAQQQAEAEASKTQEKLTKQEQVRQQRLAAANAKADAAAAPLQEALAAQDAAHLEQRQRIAELQGRQPGGPTTPILPPIPVAPAAQAQLADQGSAPQTLMLPPVPYRLQGEAPGSFDPAPTSMNVGPVPPMTRMPGPTTPVIGEAPPLWQMGPMSQVGQQPEDTQGDLGLGLPRQHATRLEQIVADESLNKQVRTQAARALQDVTTNAPGAAARADRAILRAEQAPPAKTVRPAQTGQLQARGDAPPHAPATQQQVTAPPAGQPTLPMDLPVQPAPVQPEQKPVASPAAKPAEQPDLPFGAKLKAGAGWKLHISTAGLKAQAKARLLQELKALKADYKEGQNSGQTGKDITVYAGSRENAAKLAGKLSQHTSGKVVGDAARDDTEIAPGVGARFDANGDADFHQYGLSGVPLMRQHVEAGLMEPDGGFNEANRAVADAELTRRYGEFYTGPAPKQDQAETTGSAPKVGGTLRANNAQQQALERRQQEAAAVRSAAAEKARQEEAAADEKARQEAAERRVRADAAAKARSDAEAAAAERVRKVRERAQAAVAAREAANPAGPFKDAKSNVAKTESVDQKLADVLHGWMAQLGMERVRVLLLHENDVKHDAGRRKYSLEGSYAMMPLRKGADGEVLNFGPQRQDFYVALKTGMDVVASLEAIGHELGHIIEFTVFRNASAEVRKAVRAEYDAWLKTTKGMTAQEIVRSQRPRVIGEQHAVAVGEKPLDMAYWTSFSEWFADQVAKYATTQEKPLTVVGKFFRSVAQAVKKLLHILRPSERPGSATQKFLGEMGPGAADLWMSTAQKSMLASQAMAPQQNPSTRLSTAVTQANDAAGAATKLASKMWDKAVTSKPNVGRFLRKHGLSMSTLHNIEQLFGKTFPQIARYREAMQEKTAIHERMARLFDSVYDQQYRTLERASPAAAELVNKLMRYTEFAIDPGKTWEQHKHLQGHDNEANLRDLVEKATKDRRTLNQMLGKLKADGKIASTDVFEQLVATNEAVHYALMSLSMRAMVAGNDKAMDATKAVFGKRPMTEYIDSAKYSEHAYASRDFWKATLDEQMAALGDYLATDKNAALSARMAVMRNALQTMKEAPNFHLGRYGDFFVSFDFRKLPNPDGKENKADPAAIRAVIKHMEDAGYADFVISPETERGRAFIRVDTEAKRLALLKVVQDMQAAKLVDDVKSGDRDSGDQPGAEKAKWLDEFLQHLQGSGKLTPELEAHVRSVYVDTLPDTAFSKIMLHRENIPGFSKQMMHSFAQRMNASITSLANMATIGEVSEAFAGMRATMNGIKSTDPVGATQAQQVMNELIRRETERPTRPDTTWLDRVRSFNHAYFLGASPAYVLVNITQLGSMLWPELGRTHGFRESAAAMGRASNTARKITTEMLKEGIGMGWRRAPDAVVTDNVLRKAGLSEEMIAFVTRAVNRSNIDVGGASRELGRTADPSRDSNLDLGIRYAGAAGFYAETFTRLTAALAARELHMKRNPNSTSAELDKYVDHTVTESMLNYQSWNTARAFGKQGMAGQMTPLVTAFMQYSFQVTEKLYRDLNTAFLDKLATPEEKRAARRFMGAHLAAVTVLAGSLGLPAASLFARVIEGLKDTFDGDDEPFDARAAWRNFLADIFGRDVGEVMARGLPRALGVDMSARAGEQDLLPFTRFLTDRRKLEDRIDDLGADALGSPGSMAANIALGFRDIMAGNPIQGVQRMMPVGARGVMGAYEMTQHGYRDNRGNVLPMSVEARDVLAQLIGFKPAERAEYDEARLTQQARRGIITDAGSNIRQGIVRALEEGNRGDAQNWMAQAQRFDQNNPAYAVMPTLGSALAQRSVARETARALGVPIGTNARDTGTRPLTGFANY